MYQKSVYLTRFRETTPFSSEPSINCPIPSWTLVNHRVLEGRRLQLLGAPVFPFTCPIFGSALKDDSADSMLYFDMKQLITFSNFYYRFLPYNDLSSTRSHSTVVATLSRAPIPLKLRVLYGFLSSSLTPASCSTATALFSPTRSSPVSRPLVSLPSPRPKQLQRLCIVSHL